MSEHDELPPPPALPHHWSGWPARQVTDEAEALRAIAEQLAWITMYLHGGPAGGAPRKEPGHG